MQNNIKLKCVYILYYLFILSFNYLLWNQKDYDTYNVNSISDLTYFLARSFICLSRNDRLIQLIR